MGRWHWQDLKISGKAQVRDLWQHQDRGQYGESFNSTVSAHGVVLVKITPSR